MGNLQPATGPSEADKAFLDRALVATVLAAQYTELAQDRQCYLSLLPKELFRATLLPLLKDPPWYPFRDGRFMAPIWRTKAPGPLGTSRFHFGSLTTQGNAVVYCLNVDGKNIVRAAHLESGQTIWETKGNYSSDDFCVTTDGRVCLHDVQKKTLEIFRPPARESISSISTRFMDIRGLVAIDTLIVAVSKADVFGINAESKLMPSFPAAFNPRTTWHFKGAYSQTHGNLLVGWSVEKELSVCFFDTHQQKSTRLPGEMIGEPVVVGSRVLVTYGQLVAPPKRPVLCVFDLADLSSNALLQHPIQGWRHCVIKHIPGGRAAVFTDAAHGLNVYEFDSEGNQSDRVVKLDQANIDNHIELSADNDTVILTMQHAQLIWWSISKGKQATANVEHITGMGKIRLERNFLVVANLHEIQCYIVSFPQPFIS